MDITDYANLTIEQKIERHLLAVKSEMSQYSVLCNKLDNAYVPLDRMQTGGWDVHAQNKKMGQTHISVPLVWMTVNTKSNILGMRPPTLNVTPVNRKDTDLREQAQFIETLLGKVYEDENWEELHLNVCRNLSLYGRAVIQSGMDFTLNVDQQYNVWFSYRRLGEPEAMSFAEMVSPVEAVQMGWDGRTVVQSLRFEFPIYGGFPHDDPLGARAKSWGSPQSKIYINDRVPVLHFYSKDTKSAIVRYTLAINGQIIKSQVSTGMKTWPYRSVEAEHIPGLTNGVGDAEPILDLQVDLSEALSSWGETVRRTIQDQWKVWGLKHLNPRILMDGGRVWEMTDKTEEDVEPLKFVPNTVDVKEYITTLWDIYRKTTGIPSEAEASALSHTSGYAMNVKFQALITSLAPRQIRLKRIYKELALDKINFIKKQYPEYKDLLDMKEFMLAVKYDEITPSDMQAETSRLAQQMSMKMVSPYTAMEKLGYNPEVEYKLMSEFWTNPFLNPQGAMAAAQAFMMQQQAAAQQPAPGAQGNASPEAIAQQAQTQALSFATSRNITSGFGQFSKGAPTRLGSNVTSKVA